MSVLGGGVLRGLDKRTCIPDRAWSTFELVD